MDRRFFLPVNQCRGNNLRRSPSLPVEGVRDVDVSLGHAGVPCRSYGGGRLFSRFLYHDCDVAFHMNRPEDVQARRVIHTVRGRWKRTLCARPPGLYSDRQNLEDCVSTPLDFHRRGS